ncbi:hypothetical protein NMY22_g7753 [Coprinellus aureogranulatus]|nr:hypothetical protein NMY22_g7753 [Coprinellus aureogranulatus]
MSSIPSSPALSRPPLINEKYRLLNALCMWIAMTEKVIANVPNLLYTLGHGTTSLLGQHTLARSAQSILEWTFRTYRRKQVSDTRLTSILVRICGIAHDYSKSTHAPLARLGADLSVWIDEQAFALSQVEVITERVMNALPAWARNPTGSLAGLSAAISWSNIDRVFKDEHGGPNKFRVVRRLKDYLSNESPVFQREVFWRLKGCIPSAERLHEEDAIAFTDLLLDNYGRIDSLSAEQPDREIDSIRMRHRRGTKRSQSYEEGLITEARDSIIYGLLVLLEDESPALVNTAYRTLRLVLAALPIDPNKAKSWQPVHREELSLLRSYPSPLLARPARDMSVLGLSQYVEGSAKFPSWVTHLAKLIADILASDQKHTAFGQFHPILSTDVATAEQALPVLILSLLTHEQQKDPPESTHKEILSKYFTDILQFSGSSLAVIKCIVETVIHLRYFQMKPGSGAALLSSNRWLDIDFILLAKSAVRCGAYTTALLFLELAADQERRSSLDSGTIEKIQYEIYSHIDEPDGFYGIKTSNPTHFLVQRLHHEQQWDKAFRFHGAMLEAQSSSTASSSTHGLLEAFSAFGFNSLAMQTLQQADSRSVSNDRKGTAMSYRLGWRSETWDLPDRDAYYSGSSLYNSLRAIYRERDAKVVDTQLRRSFYREVDQLRQLGIESVAEIKDVLQSLMCLDQILRWRNTSTASVDGGDMGVPQWPDLEVISPQFEFADLENIMSTRIALIRSVRQRETQRHQIGDISSPAIEGCMKLEQQCLLSLSRAARDNDQPQIALNSIIKAQKLGIVSDVSLEYANVLWSLNEPKLAVNHLSETLKEVQSSPKLSKPAILAQLGTWTSEACLEKPTDIWQKFFVPATKGLASAETQQTAELAQVYHQCAAFADRQYHSINKSPDMIRRKVYIQRKEQEIEERKSQMSQLSEGSSRHRELEIAQEKAAKLLNEDSLLHQSLRRAREEFLKEAMSLYSHCLCISDTFDNEAPIKFSSLWFANFDDEIVDESAIHRSLRRIPSRKFIFLAHQLTARLTKNPPVNQKQNQENLKRLIIRLCQEHPFHSLYQVYCLRADTVPFSSPLSREVKGWQPPYTDRSDAADEVLALLRNDEAVGNRVKDVEKACDAYLQFARFPAKSEPDIRNGATICSIRPGMKILTLNHLKIPVLTAETKVDPSMKYEDCVFIKNYKKTYETAGGVNLPKISVCVDEQNREYKQLFKGNDDMRQDAVMEQVFELVNNLYRPKDMVWSEGIKRINEAKKAGKTPAQRIKEYIEIRQRIQPVFRHYFTEKHKTPLLWFAMRLRYTRSVATTSIVGHILGLGDRHTSNILLHKDGEVVHIDLGIAFDQGKLLPVPETVPFRLTRDMVDGMGVSGTQGVFQRCSEETLRVLREGSDIIMSVLEVFKHDPLHSWTANEVKIRRVQKDVPVTAPEFIGIGIDMNSGTAEESADRALSSVERKLDKSLSVDTTVNILIAEATDVQNLGLIFGGWAPHL